jgi:DNA-binding PadR family transcriptional regulator
MAASPLTVEYALLGFLRDRPMYPYEIYQTLSRARELGLVWHLKQSHLYAILDRLEAAGYVATTIEPQESRPPRKITSLTPSGREAFARWVTTPVAHGRDFRLEFLAKLFFAAQDGPAVVTALVERQRQACHAWLTDLDAQLEAIPPDRPYDRLVLDFRIRQITAILSWLDVCQETFSPPAAG